MSPLFSAIFWYVAVIGHRNEAQEAFSGIDVQLKKRHDLIPNILAIAMRSMEHERSLLEDITRLRTQAPDTVGKPGPTAAKEMFEAAEIDRQPADAVEFLS